MERVNKILKHPIFLREQQRIKAFEKNRIYCGHQSEHLLDVARIGWIMILEEKQNIEKSVFYAAALRVMEKAQLNCWNVGCAVPKVKPLPKQLQKASSAHL